MVAVIAAAGFGVYGLITRIGSSNWKTDGSVVVEKESGAVYVYQGGVLHPMLNYASALLASGHPPPPNRVSRNSLAGVPRGVTLGIPYAPASLPDNGHVLSGPWTLCAATGTDAAGTPTTISVLALGRTVPGGRHLDDSGLLVKAAKRTYLVWHDHRYEILDSELVLPALFGGQTATTPVDQAWLNGLPEGLSIGRIPVPKSGSTSTAVPSHKVGDLLVAQTGQNPVYYLVLDDGLAQITELQKDILLGQSATQPAPISLSSANSTPKSTRLALPAAVDVRPPDRPPTLAQPPASGEPVCAESHDARSAPAVSVGGSLRDLGAGTPTGSATGTGGALADVVVVPAGRVAVVRVLASPGAQSGAYTIVTDVGLRYPVSSDTALSYLGYKPDQAVDMSADLVRLIPAGPTLDVDAAKRPADVAEKPGANRSR